MYTVYRCVRLSLFHSLSLSPPPCLSDYLSIFLSIQPSIYLSIDVLLRTTTYYYVLLRTTTYYLLLRTTTYYYVLLRGNCYVLLRLPNYSYSCLVILLYGCIRLYTQAYVIFGHRSLSRISKPATTKFGSQLRNPGEISTTAAGCQHCIYIYIYIYISIYLSLSLYIYIYIYIYTHIHIYIYTYVCVYVYIYIYIYIYAIAPVQRSSRLVLTSDCRSRQTPCSDGEAAGLPAGLRLPLYLSLSLSLSLSIYIYIYIYVYMYRYIYYIHTIYLYICVYIYIYIIY